MYSIRPCLKPCKSPAGGRGASSGDHAPEGASLVGDNGRPYLRVARRDPAAAGASPRGFRVFPPQDVPVRAVLAAFVYHRQLNSLQLNGNFTTCCLSARLQPRCSGRPTTARSSHIGQPPMPSTRSSPTRTAHRHPRARARRLPQAAGGRDRPRRAAHPRLRHRPRGGQAPGHRHFDVRLVAAGQCRQDEDRRGQDAGRHASVYLDAVGGGVHVVTVNDYLAKRDAESMGRIYSSWAYRRLHRARLDDDQRRLQYNCDVTYRTDDGWGSTTCAR